MARCEQCNGSGLADKQGPDDDELLDRVVLSAIAINGMQDDIERLTAALKRIDVINDNPSRFNSDINDVIAQALQPQS